jgi:FkbM family methyltransferase
MGEQEFNRLMDCRHGRMLYNINDRFVGRSLELYGEYSEGEIILFQQLLAADDVVVEVGANIGAHTVWFGKHTSGGGAVVAFEPQRLIFQTLCANVALNNLTNVLTFQQAVGDSRGVVQVPVLDPRTSHNFGALPLGPEQNAPGDEVPLAPLDDLVLERCRLLKVDVEGMELAVLRGARETIERCRPLLYVENDRSEKSTDLAAFITSLGYRMYWHLPYLFNPDNFRGNKENVFETVLSCNMLCTPEDVKVLGLEPVDPAAPKPPV